MVAVAHQVEHRIVAPEVVGSRPIGHPIFTKENSLAQASVDGLQHPVSRA